jgi:hypothetical protein
MDVKGWSSVILTILEKRITNEESKIRCSNIKLNKNASYAHLLLNPIENKTVD